MLTTLKHKEPSSLSQTEKKKKQTECIILLDFAEIYHYVMQNKIQGSYWNKGQYAMHLVVIYFKNDGVLHHISLCIISDDLDHETCFTHKLQRIVLLFIKENLPQIKSIHYFSGGCAGQYKNYMAFLNLCHHKSGFNSDATWAFFATNYGKSPCNRIGGTVKSKILC